MLIITLLRYELGNKFNHLITFPIKGLKLIDEEGEKIYDLIGVSCQTGSRESGHYWSHSKNRINKKWYKYNDTSVTLLKEDSIVTKNAYILFYELQ